MQKVHEESTLLLLILASIHTMMQDMIRDRRMGIMMVSSSPAYEKGILKLADGKRWVLAEV